MQIRQIFLNFFSRELPELSLIFVKLNIASCQNIFLEIITMAADKTDVANTHKLFIAKRKIHLICANLWQIFSRFKVKS